MSKLQGKVAIVTGASKGIGAGIAKQLAADGAAVVVNYASSQEGADKVVSEILKNGGRAVAVQGDVSKAADRVKLLEQTLKTFESLDVLVNNAGVFKFDQLSDVSEEEFHRQFNTNVLGLIMMVKEAVPHFGPNGGTIINVGSAITISPPPGSVVYAATKGAVDMITRVLAKELGPKRIRVNSVNPGGVETEGFVSTGILGSEMEKQMISSTPLGRLGQPEDIAQIATFLASSESYWINGEAIMVSGGYR